MVRQKEEVEKQLGEQKIALEQQKKRFGEIEVCVVLCCVCCGEREGGREGGREGAVYVNIILGLVSLTRAMWVGVHLGT